MSSEFLNARSMATPGIIGALIMMVSNTLGTTFALGGPARGLVALGLSFLVGLLVLGDKKVPALTRVVLYVVNSLVIFSVSVGTNGIGGAAAPPPVVVEVAPSPTPPPVGPSPHPTSTPAPPATLPTAVLDPAVLRKLQAAQNRAFFHTWTGAQRVLVPAPAPTPKP